jgi:hypothetical protein
VQQELKRAGHIVGAADAAERVHALRGVTRAAAVRQALSHLCLHLSQI